MRKCKPKKIHIIKDGQKKEYNLIDIPRSLLLTYNDPIEIANNKYKKLLVDARPTLGLKKERGRYAKDKTYLLMREHALEGKIAGKYAGLTANYPGEIFTVFQPFIRGEFNSYELKYYDKLKYYFKIMKDAYPWYKHKVEFKLYNANILEHLRYFKRNLAIIDLDLMTTLWPDQIEELANTLKSCLKEKAVLGVWQTVGRQGATCEQFEEELRPLLTEKISNYFDIKRYNTHDYWEGYPIRCDILTLQRRENV